MRISGRATRALIRLDESVTPEQAVMLWHETATRQPGQRSKSIKTPIETQPKWVSPDGRKIVTISKTAGLPYWRCLIISSQPQGQRYLETIFKQTRRGLICEFAVPTGQITSFNDLLEAPRSVITKFAQDSLLELSEPRYAEMTDIDDVNKLADAVRDHKRTQPIVVISGKVSFQVESLAKSLYGFATVRSLSAEHANKIMELLGRRGTAVAPVRVYLPVSETKSEMSGLAIIGSQDMNLNVLVDKICLAVERDQILLPVEEPPEAPTETVSIDPPDKVVAEKTAPPDQPMDRIDVGEEPVTNTSAVLDNNVNHPPFEEDNKRTLSQNQSEEIWNVLDELTTDYEQAIQRIKELEERILVLEKTPAYRPPTDSVIVDRKTFDDMTFIADSMIEIGRKVRNDNTFESQNVGLQRNEAVHKEEDNSSHIAWKRHEHEPDPDNACNEHQFPSQLDVQTLEEYTQANLPNVVVHQKAKRAIKRRTGHSNPQRIYAILKVLNDYYAPMRSKTIDLDMKDFEGALASLYCNVLARRTDHPLEADYSVTYEGHRHVISHEIRSNSSPYDPNVLIRVYFFWDDKNKKVIVCHLPDHMKTTQGNS